MVYVLVNLLYYPWLFESFQMLTTFTKGKTQKVGGKMHDMYASKRINAS